MRGQAEFIFDCRTPRFGEYPFSTHDPALFSLISDNHISEKPDEQSTPASRGTVSEIAQSNVVEDGQPLRKQRMLEGPRYSEVGSESRALCQLNSGKRHLSGIGFLYTRDDVNERRFPGSIRSHDANDFTFLHLEAHLRQGLEAPKPLADAIDPEDCIPGRWPRCLGRSPIESSHCLLVQVSVSSLRLL